MIDYTVPENKLIVGLTGNIATGKSAVMRMAAERGALTIDADGAVHEILAGDTAVQQAIEARFGPTVRRANGAIDRAALGQIVFNDPQALRDLELLVHPAVHNLILLRINTGSERIVIIEAIKLLEGRLHTICRQVWVTTCKRQRQLERLLICRGLDEETAVARIDAQADQKLKIAQADVVINTDGLLRETGDQVEVAWSALAVSSLRKPARSQ